MQGRAGSNQFAWWKIACIVYIASMCVGCGPAGPKTYRVEGTVTFDGEPILAGYITFSPQQRGETPVATQIKEGKYSLYATAGAKRISVQASRFIGPENPIMGLRAKEQYIPDRYNIETTLSATVSPEGENKFDFELTSIVETNSEKR